MYKLQRRHAGLASNHAVLWLSHTLQCKSYLHMVSAKEADVSDAHQSTCGSSHADYGRRCLFHHRCIV